MLYAPCGKIQATHFVADSEAAWAGFKSAYKTVDAGVLEELYDMWDEHASGNLEMLKAFYGEEYSVPGV